MIKPCLRCIGGSIISGSCLNCGYQEIQPSQLPLIFGNGHGRDRQDYDGIKREWRRPRVLVDRRRSENK